MTLMSRLTMTGLALTALVLAPDLVWAAGEAADAGKEGGGGMPQLEAPIVTQLFWLAVTFGGLYLLLSKGALPQIGDTLERREERLSGDIARATELRQQAEDMQRDNERLMEQARLDAQASIDKTRADCEAEAAAASAEAEAEIVAKLDEAEASINAKRGDALAALPETANGVASAIAERLGLELDADAVAKAISRRQGA